MGFILKIIAAGLKLSIGETAIFMGKYPNIWEFILKIHRYMPKNSEDDVANSIPDGASKIL